MIYRALFLLFLAHAAAAEDYVVKAVQATDLKPVAAVVESVHHSFARTRIGGTIDGLAVDEGSHVERGQVMAIVVDPKQPLEIDAMDARIRSQEHERDLAALEKKRYGSLTVGSVVSQAKLDEVNTRLRVLETSIAALKAQRAATVEHRGEGKVLAPLAGRVLKVPVTNGSVVMPGDVVAEIAVDGFILRLSIPERHARFLKQGGEVRLGAREEGGENLTGTIQKLYPKLEEGRVIADVAVEKLEDFFIGARRTAYIATSSRKAFVIPESYLIRRHGLTYVRLKDGGDIVVQTGLASPEGVEILSGINDGDILVTP
ncbi:MAG: efflux RND transporter periplasmic adaptor subunit [Alphaproteobacteria bacterium]|nr:efflux RND transporter periplasmic adaptor subunit [Alphaproteobacteria bacterium]